MISLTFYALTLTNADTGVSVYNQRRYCMSGFSLTC
jgi:hypothetical protein